MRLLVRLVLGLALGYDQPGYAAPAEGAGWGWQAQGRGVRLVVAAEGERAVGAHLVPAVLNLDGAYLVEADAAEFSVTGLQRSKQNAMVSFNY